MGEGVYGKNDIENEEKRVKRACLNKGNFSENLLFLLK